MTKRDGAVLLGLAVLVLAFVAYEMAGLSLPGWDTVSFFSQRSDPLFVTIFALFILGGLGGAGWWYWHIKRAGRIPK